MLMAHAPPAARLRARRSYRAAAGIDIPRSMLSRFFALTFV